MTKPTLADDERTSPDREGGPQVARRDPIADLLRFHDDIRDALDALALCVTSARRGDLDPAAATYLSRFFDGPLLWHDEDEEVSVMRRLRAMALSPAERASVESAHRGHDRMEMMLEVLVPALRHLAAGAPLTEPEAFEREARALRSLLEGHLKMEEEQLFPLAARLFSALHTAEIAREIDARHGRAMGHTQRNKRVIPL